ncbi:hypothetical protein LINPERHAP2_LOCUS36995 [Linum perenne]
MVTKLQYLLKPILNFCTHWSFNNDFSKFFHLSYIINKFPNS